MAKSNCKSGAEVRSRRNWKKERRWPGLIARQRKSGESVRTFCRTRGLGESLFHYWRGQVEAWDRARGGRPKASPILTPVVVVDEPSDDSKGRASATIGIVLNEGATVRGPADSTREHLAMVLFAPAQIEC